MTVEITKATNDDDCGNCGSSEVSVVVMPATHSDDGLTVSYSDEYSLCGNCGDEFYTSAQSAANSRAITTAIRKAKNLPTGDEIRDARTKNLHMTLPQFEKALGVGSNTVGRWERGTVAPSGAATVGLWLAINQPKMFLQFAQSRGVVPKREIAQGTLLEARSSQGPSRANAQPVLTVSSGGSTTTKTGRPYEQAVSIFAERESVEA